MQLQDAIALIRTDKLSSKKPVTWADLGCGTGLFSRALATLVAPENRIYAIDSDRVALRNLTGANGVAIETICLDFVRDEWPFSTVDGLLMANSLHYVADKSGFLQKAGQHLNETGCFLFVEYDTDSANPWVPYPIRYASLKQLFQDAGYSTVEKLHQMPSRYGRANLYGAYVSRY